MNFKKTLAELVLPLFLNCAIPETYLQTSTPAFDPKEINWKKAYLNPQKISTPEMLDAYNQLISNLTGKAILKTTRIKFSSEWATHFMCAGRANGCYNSLFQKIYFSADVPLSPLKLAHEQGHFLDQDLNVFSDRWSDESEAYAFILYFIASFYKKIDREIGAAFFSEFFKFSTPLHDPLKIWEEQKERENTLIKKNNFERLKTATELYLQKEFNTAIDSSHSLGYNSMLILLVSNKFNFDSKQVYDFVSTARKEEIVEKINKTLESYSFADLNKKLKEYFLRVIAKDPL